MIIPVMEKALPNIALEHFPELLDSIRMSTFTKTYAQVLPLLNWSITIIDALPSEASVSDAVDAGATSESQSFTFPAKVLRIGKKEIMYSPSFLYIACYGVSCYYYCSAEYLLLLLIFFSLRWFFN